MGIFKIFRTAEWAAFQSGGVFKGSSDDLRDGFIHFSSEDHLAGTMARYFKDEAELIIAKVENANWGEQMKWEGSRGGALFPHLYTALMMADVAQSWTLSKTASAAWDLSTLASDLNIVFAPADI